MNEYAALKPQESPIPASSRAKVWSMPSLRGGNIPLTMKPPPNKADHQYTAMIASSLEAILPSLSD